MPKEICLKYGRGKVRFNLPFGRILGVLKPRQLPRLEDPQRYIIDKLRKPLGTPPLREIVKRRDRVCIVVSDISRATKAEVFLPPLLDELNLGGIRDKDIFVLFAQGSHRLHTKDERISIVGAEVSERISLFDHDCHDSGNHTYLGRTKWGTSVRINKLAVEANRVILTGSIVYHYFAGFSGGRKSVLPGISAHDIIRQNHGLIYQNGGERGGPHPMCRSGVLHGNPVHEDMMEATYLLSPDFLLNVILAEDGEISKVLAGKWDVAHDEGCKILREVCEVKISKPADLVIGSCGGYPKDINIIQTHKAIDNAFYAASPGSVIIILAECQDGIGSDTFLKWCSYQTIEEHEKALREGFEISGNTAYALRRKAKETHIILVSSLSPQIVQRMFMEPAGSIDEALDLARRKLERRGDPTIYLIPYANITRPTIA